MKVSRFWLRALNVRRDEWWLVQKLFLLQFFQGAGIAFFFTAAITLFLKKFPVSGLAYVFIITSFLLWAAGYFYGKLEHQLPGKKLNRIITIILAISMIFFWIGAKYIPFNWFFYLMLAWFNVLYLLNNLMFWGLAAQLYDVRQSKRLFGVISAGDIPAKFIGYTVALLVVAYIGTANLLLAGFFFILFSFPFLKSISKSRQGEHHHTSPPVHSHELQTIVKDYTINILIRRVAILSLIVSASIVLINYGFYAEVKAAYKNDVQLAGFIALFLASARLLALMLKIIATSRIIHWLGNRAALHITPTLLIVLIVILLLTDTMMQDSKTLLYIFGLSAILIDALNSALNSPVVLTMMQPLSTHERLRAHNIVKGIMDPFAYLFGGLLLLAAFKFNFYTLQNLSFILLALAIAWVIGVFRVHQQYLKTLIKTISTRFFSQEEFNIYDTEAREMIGNKIQSGTELEVMYILNMLGSRNHEESNQLIIQALHHPSGRVVKEAMKLTGKLQIKEAEPHILDLISNNPSEEIKSEAIKLLGKMNFNDEVIAPLMQHENKTISHSAIISVVNYSSTRKHKEEAEKKIRELIHAPGTDDKKAAIAILMEAHNINFDEVLIRLSDENDKSLQLAAIKAMGHHPSLACVETLIKKLDTFEKPVIEALIIAGEKALMMIRDTILSGNCTPRQKTALVQAIGRISSRAADEILIGLMHDDPALQAPVIRLLHRNHFRAAQHHQLFIEALIRKHLEHAAVVLHMQKGLLKNQGQFEFLFRSLTLELSGIRENLLLLFSFLYDRNQINRIKKAIEINKKESQANAIELVDLTVKKEFAIPFNAAFEHEDIEHRCSLLKNFFAHDLFLRTEHVIEEVLSDHYRNYNAWTKACSLYVSKIAGIRLKEPLTRRYLDSEAPLLKETAMFAIQND